MSSTTLEAQATCKGADVCHLKKVAMADASIWPILHFKVSTVNLSTEDKL